MADPATMLTLGYVLNQLMSKLGGLIEKAENAGEVLAISAGNQIALAIQWAQQAYSDSLNLTTDRLTAAQKQIVDDLTTEIGYLEQNALQGLRDLVDQGSMALNTLPLSDHFPQLGRFAPSFVAPSNEDAIVDLYGNFFDSGKGGYSPVLVIGGKSLTPTITSTLRLSFRVPSELFQHQDAKLSFADATLQVPYAKHVLFIPVKETAQFKISFVGLPKSAGKIRFYTDRSEYKTVTQQNKSGEFRQESTNDDIPDPIGSGRVSSSPPSPGWFVIPNTVHLNVTWAEGDWKDFGNRSNLAAAAWSIATVHHGLGTSGKVHFFLSWTEQQNQLADVPGEQDSDLEWSSSRVFNVPAGATWHATYVDFSGKSFDINAPSFTNPYIKIVTSGNSVAIVTIP